MRVRFARLAAVLSALGFLAWLLLRERGGPLPEHPLARTGDGPALQERRDGSAVACAIPLAWRIARVDPDFGLSTARAREALRQAAALWEEAVGQPVAIHDSAAGFPVRLVYDERQARTIQRRRAEEEFDRRSQRLEAWRAQLNGESERLSQAEADHAQRLRELQVRVAGHNAMARGWNERGGAPAEVRAELRAAERALEAERRALTERTRELEALRRRLRDEGERFDRAVKEHERQRAALEKAFPASRVESGSYREAVRTREGRIVSVEREIRIYRFDGAHELLLVLVHELGHALGLGHTAVPGAVMNQEFRRAGASAGAPRIHPADIELLRSRCPNLRGAPSAPRP